MNRPVRILVGIAIGVLDLLMAIAFITALPRWLGAQAPRYHPASDRAAVALHERHLRLTGTATAPAHHHSVVEMRVGDGPPVRTETWMSRPDRMVIRSTVGGKPLLEFGFDGTTGWSEMPGTGLVTLPKPELDQLRASALRLSTPTIDSTVPLRAIPRQRFDGQLVDGIRMVTATGDTAYLYYAVSTGYMAGMLFRTPSSRVTDSTVTFLRDYRRVGGRVESFVIVTRSPLVETTARTVELGFGPIEAGRFRAPVGVR